MYNNSADDAPQQRDKEESTLYKIKQSPLRLTVEQRVLGSIIVIVPRQWPQTD